MKKIVLLITALCIQIYLLLAQPEQKKNYGMVTYERTINFNNSSTTSFRLFFNPNFSVFYEDITDNQEETRFKPSSDDEYDFSFNLKLNDSKYIVYTDFERDSILSQISLFKNGKQATYIVEEKICTIKWEIKNEFKKINDLKVQKAIGDFRGRRYEAWFANEIPVKYGPWKLNGLPGLILNVSDDHNVVSFNIKTIKIPIAPDSISTDEFQFNCDFEKISLAEYVKLENQQIEELTKILSSKLPRGAIFNLTENESNSLELEYE